VTINEKLLLDALADIGSRAQEILNALEHYPSPRRKTLSPMALKVIRGNAREIRDVARRERYSVSANIQEAA